ncbi:MAG: hypothetical protein NT138_01885 [Planctomycetales bacterium]|nr:hypothetical protein [Planctomycetales bacterium]
MFSQQYAVPESNEPTAGTSSGSGFRTDCFRENWVCGNDVYTVLKMGVALGQITSPKHPAGILVIAVLAAMLVVESGEILQCRLLMRFTKKSVIRWLMLWV